MPVVLKVPNGAPPSSKQLARLNHEYQTIQSFSHRSIVKAVGLEKINGGIVLVLSDIGGETLQNLLEQGSLLLEQTLRIAFKISEALEYIHANKIIHQNLCPANLIYNPATRRLNIIDFQSATDYPVPISPAGHFECFRTDLAYIAPEQTGRTSISTDFRSDLYSLGTILYELVTGKPPFAITDPLQLIHSHIARQPTPPKALSPDLPVAVSDIILKLLAKTPNRRYQSAAGIKEDLKACLKQLQAGQKIAINIGAHDVPGKLEIPDKLYGRGPEIKQITAALEQARHGRREIVTIRGHSGVGKTSLIHTMERMGFFHPGYFIAGKFDQLHTNIPYSAVKSAFKLLIEQILTESEPEFERWRSKLLQALDPNGQLIIDIIPELEMIIGPQKPVSGLTLLEEKNRFGYVFTNFIHALIEGSRTIILFLDDLQWADHGSLELIRIILTSSGIRRLLFIGAYRDDELNQAAPWVQLVREIEQAGVPVRHVLLDPLSLPHIATLVSDALNCSMEQCRPISEIILAKTDGNPFFITEFLLSVDRRGFLQFDPIGKKWHWDLEKIRSMAVSDGVAGFLLKKIDQLSPATVSMLKTASCIGSRFDLKTLSIVCRTGMKDIIDSLRQAVNAGVVSCMTDLRFINKSDLSTETRGKPIEGRFSHDSIQKAVFGLIPGHQRAMTHWKIGNRLLTYYAKREIEPQLFAIVNQLNAGRPEILDDEGKQLLIELNLRAGKKAKAAAAYESAYDYFKTGCKILESFHAMDRSENFMWQRFPDLCLAHYEGAAETAFLTGKYKEMDHLITVVDQNVRSLHKKAKVYEIKTGSLYARGQMNAAIEVALTYAGGLGIRIPRNPGKRHILSGIFRIRRILANKTLEDLAELPPMKDPNTLAALQVLSCATLAAFYSRPNLLPMIVFTSIRFSLRYGNTDGSIFGYAGYGMMLCAVFSDMNQGYAFGKLALRLVDDMQVHKIRARITATVYGFINHWKEHLGRTLPPLEKGLLAGLETGDHQFVSTCARRYCSGLFFLGRDLVETDTKTSYYLNLIKSLKINVAHTSMCILKQGIQNLRLGDNEPWHLRGRCYDMELMESRLQKANDRFALFFQFSMSCMLCYLFGRIEKAATFSDRARRYHEAARGMPEHAAYIFYDALIRLAGEKTSFNRLRIFRQVGANRRLLKKWFRFSPVNFSQKYFLVQAEYCRQTGDDARAEKYYTRAIEAAGANGYLHDEAIANERAALFYQSVDNPRAAKDFMLRAHQGFQKWGADALARDLEKRFPQLLTDIEDPAMPEIFSPVSKPAAANSTDAELIQKHDMDIYTVLEASRVIARETEIKPLMACLIRLIIQNSGASKAFLVLKSDHRLKVEAFAQTNPEKIDVLQSIPIDDQRLPLPISIIHYVVRSGESVILDSNHEGNRFRYDRHIIEKRPLSALCTPVFSKNNKLGVLYLENNLTEGAFSKERLQILDILISQAAVSIENSMLYEKLHREADQKSKAVGDIIIHKKLLQDMSAQLAAAEEKERKAIADDLHDSVTQTLALSILKLKQFSRQAKGEKLLQLSEIREHLEHAVDEIRSLTFQLSPRVLYDFGLQAAIEWLADDMQKKFGLVVHVKSMIDNALELNATIRVILFRATRELLINVFKHAKTNTAGVRLFIDKNYLNILVEDHGAGFSEIRDTQNKSGGFGLCSIGERLQALDGKMIINSEPENGTRIVLRVPLEQNEGSTHGV